MGIAAAPGNSRGFFAICRSGEILISWIEGVSSRPAQRSRFAIAMAGNEHPKGRFAVSPLRSSGSLDAAVQADGLGKRFNRTWLVSAVVAGLATDSTALRGSWNNSPLAFLADSKGEQSLRPNHQLRKFKTGIVSTARLSNYTAGNTT